MHAAQLAGMYVVAVAEAVLLGRLLLLRLHRPGHYPFFVAFLVADLAQTLAAICNPYPLQSPMYFWLWAGSETVLVVLQTLAAREVWTRVRASYPGIGRVGEEIGEWVFILALLVSVASLFLDVVRANWQWATWSGALLLRRAFVTMLALTVGAVAYCMRWAPDPIAPNVRRHARIFAGYLATSALFSFLITIQMLTSQWASLLKLSASAIWLGFWIWAFRSGQEQAPRPEGTATDEDVDVALRKLKNIADDLGQLASGLSKFRPSCRRGFGAKITESIEYRA